MILILNETIYFALRVGFEPTYSKYARRTGYREGVVFVIVFCSLKLPKNIAQTVGIEPTRRGFGDLTDTLSVTRLLYPIQESNLELIFRRDSLYPFN